MVTITEQKTLPLSAIKNGTIIDHIKTGFAVKILHLVNLLDDGNQVTLGLNMVSKRLGIKDLIKVSDLILEKEKVLPVAIFSPDATINIIEDYKVCEKYYISIPEKVDKILLCKNNNCITNHEDVETSFTLSKESSMLSCRYCRKSYSLSEVKI